MLFIVIVIIIYNPILAIFIHCQRMDGNAPDLIPQSLIITQSTQLNLKNAHVLDGNAPDLAAECADYERKIAEVFYVINSAFLLVHKIPNYFHPRQVGLSCS